MSLSRVLSGIVAIALALGMIILGGWYFTVCFGIIVWLGESEYFNLVRAKGVNPAGKTSLFFSEIMLIVATIAPEFTNAVFPLAGAFICFYLLFQPKFGSIADISSSILGLFYCGLLPSYWVRIRVSLQPPEASNLPFLGYFPESWLDFNSYPDALKITLLAFSCIWAADIGAYFMGKFFGRIRLSEISPKKTVEGAIFGIAACLLVAEFGAWYLNWPKWEISGAIFGLLIGVVSLLGDLTESMIKRDAGVKDSSQLIPGHGGILDRTDSYVFTAPVVYYFITIFLPWLASI